MKTDITLAEQLFELCDESDKHLYSTALDGDFHLYEIVSTTEFKEVNYAPNMSAWSVIAPAWTQYAFAVVLDGDFLICAGPSDVQTAKQAIDDCLDTLYAAGDFDEDIRRSGPVSEVNLDIDLPNPVEVDSRGDGLTIDIDYDIRRQKQIQLVLTNPPVEFNEIQIPSADWPVPVAYQEDQVIINGKKCSGDRSPNEQYTVAYTNEELFLFTKAALTANLSISGIRAASISNSGVALIAGDLSESDQSGISNGTELQVEFEVSPPDYSKFNDELAFYSLEGTLLHRESVPGLVLDGAIAADGTYAAVLTETAETTTLHMYNVPDQTKIWEHETRDEHPSQLGEKKEAATFERSEGEDRIVLSETPADDPTYAVNLSGKVVWTTDQVVVRDDISGLITKLEEPEETIPSLENSYDSRRDVVQALETIASRHPEPFEDHIQSLVTILEAENVPTKANAPQEPDPSTSLLYSALGDAPELIRPYLDRLSELVIHRGDPVAQPAADCLESAAKSEKNQEAIVRRFEPLFEHSSIPVRVLRILDPVLNELLRENPSRSELLAETIRRTTLLENQRALFRVLKSNINRHHPDAVRKPIAEPTTRQYINLVEIFQEAVTDGGQLWEHEAYHNALHGDTAQVLEQILDVQPPLIDELVGPLLKQGLAATDLDRAAPGDPSTLLQLCCVIDESRVRTALNENRSIVERFVTQTDELASVDLLLCLGDEFATEQLETLASKQKAETQREQRSTWIRDRAAKAVQLLDADVRVEPSIKEVNLLDPTTRNAYFYNDLVTHKTMRVRAQYCVNYLRTSGSAMRGDFEASVVEEGNPILGAFDEWWDSIRWILKQVPEVDLEGHTYVYNET